MCNFVLVVVVVCFSPIKSKGSDVDLVCEGCFLGWKKRIRAQLSVSKEGLIVCEQSVLILHVTMPFQKVMKGPQRGELLAKPFGKETGTQTPHFHVLYKNSFPKIGSSSPS